MPQQQSKNPNNYGGSSKEVKNLSQPTPQTSLDFNSFWQPGKVQSNRNQ
jgi:hypothetical protein